MKNGGWETTFFFGRPIFRGYGLYVYVSFKEGILKCTIKNKQHMDPFKNHSIFPTGDCPFFTSVACFPIFSASPRKLKAISYKMGVVLIFPNI